MSKIIDVRDSEEVTKIVFADDDFAPSAITKGHNSIKLISADGEEMFDLDFNKAEYVEDLIKALNKAIELGWFN